MLRDTHHGRRCAYCPRQMSNRDARLYPTRDHVIPRCAGGGLIVICCATCNTIKADMMPEAWEAFMEATPGWWKLSRAELRLLRRQGRRLYGVPNARGDMIRRWKCGGARQGTPPMPPVIVPRELVYGHGKEGHPHPVAAVVGAPPQMEAGVLEEGTQGGAARDEKAVVAQW